MICKRAWSFLLLGFATTLAVNRLAAENVTSSQFGQEGDQSPLLTQRAYNRLSLKVMDQSGAYLPHAHVTIADVAFGAINEKDADALGRAEFLLHHGEQYKATVRVPGFKVYVETFKVESDIAKTVTLIVGSTGSPIVIDMGRGLTPVEYLPLAVEIPQQPLRLLQLPARPIRLSHHRR